MRAEPADAPAYHAAPALVDTFACNFKNCRSRDLIERDIGPDGRVVSVACRACRLTSLYQLLACAECEAETGHLDTCSFATLWGV